MPGNGTMETARPSGSVLRTMAAVVVLLLFWGALARALWPEFAPALLQVLQAARGAGVEPIETEHLIVRNASRADESVLGEAIARLEEDLVAIEAVAADQAGSPRPSSHPDGHLRPARGGDASLAPGRESEEVGRIPVTVMEGSGPALSDGAGLTLFHDEGRIDLSTAPFLLALLREGSLSMSGLRLFVDGGYAVYLTEEAGRAGALLGQSSDAWTVLLRGTGSYVPLAEAWEAGLPRGERETAVVVRVLLEGGSFVRWIIAAHGLEAVQALREGVPVAEAIGTSLGEAEAQWLGTLAGVEGQPCEEVLPETSPLRGYCGALLQ
jgi:hypothetical protein